MKNNIRFTVWCLSILSALCSSSCNNKQEVNRNQVVVGENWPNRTSFDLLIEISSVGMGNQSASASKKVHVELHRLNSGKHLCFWTPKSANVSPANGVAEKLMNITKGIRHEILINEDGVVEGLLNWTTIKNKGYLVVHEIIVSLEKDPKTLELRKAIRVGANELLKNRESVELHSLKYANYFFGLAKLRLKYRDTLEREAALLAPFTNLVIPYKQKIVLNKAYSDSTCDIRLVDDISPEMIRDISQSMLSNLTPQDKYNDMSAHMNDFVMKHRVQYEVDIRTGMVNRLIADRTIKVGEQYQVERTEIIRE